MKGRQTWGDLGRDSTEMADGELGLYCGEPERASEGVVSSNLDFLGGAAISSSWSVGALAHVDIVHKKQRISYYPSYLEKSSPQCSQ